MYARAFAPGHITGFVEFPKIESGILFKGSKGAGVCIEKGIITEAWVYKSDVNKVEIEIDGYTSDTEVSSYVVNEYINMLEYPVYIRIKHRVDIPIGYGLGSSGAAALSLSYALNKALGTGLSKQDAARIAHKADIECRCGAGTVIAEYHGGFEMRLSSGAPGIGVVNSMPLHGYKVIALCINPYPTREFLTNRMDMINGLGGKMLKRLVSDPSVDEFMDMSLTFAKSIEFISSEASTIIDRLREYGYGTSVALFGNTVFSIVKDCYAEHLYSILAGIKDEKSILLISDVDNRGARLIG